MTNKEQAESHFNGGARATGAAETGAEKTRGEDTDVNQGGPDTVRTDGSRDVQSDPALNDSPGQEWADEGGATPDGPATSST